MVKEAIIYFAIGLILGGVYFSSLWISLSFLKRVENKKLYLTITTIIRFVLLLLALFFIIKGKGQYNILYTLIGFVISRTIILKIKGISAADILQKSKEETKNG